MSVALAIPYGGPVDPAHVRSVAWTMNLLGERGIKHDFLSVAGCCYIDLARNMLADQFLKSDCDQLFMVDSDIAWDAKYFESMLFFAGHAPVVCAAYPMKTEPTTVVVRPPPGNAEKIDATGLFAIGGTGLGFTVVQRKVIEALAKDSPLMASSTAGGGPIPRIFACETTFDGYLGEDIKFFEDCWAHGFPVKLATGVRLHHMGTKAYSLPKGWKPPWT